MKTIAKLTAIAALLAVTSVQAQQVKVATGGSKGTYHALFANIAEKCGEQMAMVEVPTDGSITNLDKLAGKEVGAAFMQTDVLFASAQGRDLGNIKTLVAFNKESVHVIAGTASGLRTSGNMVGMGKEDIVFSTAEDLSGYKIAAAGGSVVTAQLIKLQGQINWSVVPVADNDAALAAVKAGQVQAAVLVGGQPMPIVKSLTGGVKLLPFKPTTVELLKTVYTPQKLSYTKLSTNAVSSIATDALLVTRTVNTPERLTALSNLRACISKNVPEWQDADGAHPAWSEVDLNNKGKWAYYDLPAATIKTGKK
jgi:TRAP-type uncharacterized transport system substrate-binding protein